MAITFDQFMQQGWGSGDNGWQQGLYINNGNNQQAYQNFLADTMQTPTWDSYRAAQANQPVGLQWLSGGDSQASSGTDRDLMIDPKTGRLWMNPNAATASTYAGLTTVDPATGWLTIDPSKASLVAKTSVDKRNDDYKGGDFLSNFISNYAVPGFMAGVGALATGGAGLGALGELAGDAYMPAALGADGLGSVGAAGTGLAGDAYMPAALGADGVNAAAVTGGATGAATGSLSQLPNASLPNVPSLNVPSSGGSGSISSLSGNVAGDAYLPGSLPSGVGDAYMPGALNGTGSQLAGSVGNVAGDAYMPGALNSTATAADAAGAVTGAGYSTTWQDLLKQYLNSPTSSLKNLTSSKSGITNPDGSINWGNLISGGLTTAGGLATYNRQNQLWDSGADSRARFNNAMTPGFDLSTMPGYKSALDTSSDAFTRSLSAKGGNPAGTGSAQAETQKYLMGSVGLPYLKDYETQNAAVGWNPASLGTSTAPSDLSGSLGKATALLTPNTGQADISSQVGNLSQLTDYLKQAGVKVGDLFTAWGN